MATIPLSPAPVSSLHAHGVDVNSINKASSGSLLVWEDLRQRGGDILYTLPDNATVVRRLSKRDVDAGQNQATTDGSNATCCGLGFSLAALSASPADLLGKRLLAGGDDPDEAAVEAALPAFIAAEAQIAAFVGSRKGPSVRAHCCRCHCFEDLDPYMCTCWDETNRGVATAKNPPARPRARPPRLPRPFRWRR